VAEGELSLRCGVGGAGLGCLPASPTDLVTLGTTVAVVAGAALLASALPARRATQADLMSALRDT